MSPGTHLEAEAAEPGPRGPGAVRQSRPANGRDGVEMRAGESRAANGRDGGAEGRGVPRREWKGRTLKPRPPSPAHEDPVPYLKMTAMTMVSVHCQSISQCMRPIIIIM